MPADELFAGWLLRELKAAEREWSRWPEWMKRSCAGVFDNPADDPRPEKRDD